MSTSKPILLTPGPVTLPSKIKKALQVDPPYFAGKDFSLLLADIRPKLQAVFQTSYPVLIGTGSGSLGMEAAVCNFVGRGSTVVVAEYGKYGKNWVEMCRLHGLNVEVLHEVQFPSMRDRRQVYAKQIQLGSVQLSPGNKVRPEVSAVFITHVETTIGLVAPLQHYIRQIKAFFPNALIIVDMVSSLLTEPSLVDQCDVVVCASQKALSLPPGLFFLALSDRAYKRHLDLKACHALPRLFYFDVETEFSRWHGNTTTFTPATNLIYALNVALDEILKVGPTVLIARTKIWSSLAKRFADPSTELPLLPLFVLNSQAANCVTAYRVPGRSGRFIQKLYERNVIVGDGVREWRGRIIRIAHFGWGFQLSWLVTAYDEILQILRKEEYV